MCVGVVGLTWSLAVTPPNRELSTARALARHEFPHHVFKLRRKAIVRGRPVERLRPAFPGYVFLVAQDQWLLLHEMGISYFVERRLPEGIVEGLLGGAVDEDVLPINDAPSLRFRVGQQVLIRGQGLLAGQIGLFQHLVDEVNCIVLLEWLGRWVPMLVDERELTGDIDAEEMAKKDRKWHRRKRHGRHRRGVSDPSVN